MTWYWNQEGLQEIIFIISRETHNLIQKKRLTAKILINDEKSDVWDDDIQIWL